MRLVIQRVSSARVLVDGSVTASIGVGLVVLIGIEESDDVDDVRAGVDKLTGLRVFPDGGRKMNLSPVDAAAEFLVVSQFTLLADVDRGRRPSFTRAAEPGQAAGLIESFCAGLVENGLTARTGVFGAEMSVDLVNEGPVTLVIDVKGGRVC